MKHRYATTLAAAAVAAAGIGTSLGFASSASAATTAAGPAAAVSAASANRPRPVVLDCGPRPLALPASYILTCGDGGTGIEGMRWTSWTAGLASGYGTFYQNDCVPDCAAGKFIRYPVLAAFWGSAAVPGHPGDRRYTELTLIFTGQRPPVYGPGGEPSYPLTQTFAAGRG
jgi:hypothetical protein